MMTLLCVQDFCLECQCLYFCILLDIVMCGMRIFCDFCWFWGLCCYPIFISLWSLLLILLYSPPLFGHSFIISLSLCLLFSFPSLPLPLLLSLIQRVIEKSVKEKVMSQLRSGSVHSLRPRLRTESILTRPSTSWCEE